MIAPLQEADWATLTTWVAQAAPLADGQSPPTIATLMQPQTGWLARTLALDEIGLAAEARAEWRAGWQSEQNHPHTLALLARIAHEHGRADVVLDIVDQLLEQVPASANNPLPVILARLRMPTPYAQSVLPAAQEQQIDPLLLYALMRQESRFAAQIMSAVGAYGLAQVMPDTALGIAERLQITDFRAADLARPALNIRFGAFYLGTQLRQLDDNTYAALAAYNGGPTNALRWLQAPGGNDPDRFVEGIDYGETRTYVKIVYANYAAYQRLYQPEL
jgi:soluble lytic murein transglycosylase